MEARTFSQNKNPRNNIILMTDGYKFSHHKQYPVSWMPEKERGAASPAVLFPGKGGAKGSIVIKILPVPCPPGTVKKLTIITNISTAVVSVEPAAAGATPDMSFDGTALEYTGSAKEVVCVALGADVLKRSGLDAEYATVTFTNVDESKLKRGSALNTFAGGYNVSYFTPRGYKDQFDGLASESTGDHIVFYGLQYLIKEYLTGTVVTQEKVDEAEAFIARYMADVRFLDAPGFDYTMFPRGDWMAMATGDLDGTGVPVAKPGVLPIKIEALPEGSLAKPNTCLFKITNTHPRFFWLPNFLETLLVQVWYPTTVATQTREIRKTIQAYSYLSQRESWATFLPGPSNFNIDNIVEDQLGIHVSQVFDLLDFGYRGVSSHETAQLGGSAYYVPGYEGSDTVAGSRMALWAYEGFKGAFEFPHSATSIPAAEHSTVTSWTDLDPKSDPVKAQQDEYCAFSNMIKQYMPSYGISLVSDGFNVWNSVANHWPSEAAPSEGAQSMRAMLKERLAGNRLNLVRPDSGDGIETLPQLLTILHAALPEHTVPGESGLGRDEMPELEAKFAPGHPKAAKWEAIIAKIQAKVGTSGNPFRRFVRQNMRVLQGDGVQLDTIGDMLASLVANGFCSNTAHFGSGGGLLQKVNRDSLSCAFKCCAMYVGDKAFVIGKDPIAGGKKSYAGNPCVLRGADGVLYNRPEPMSFAEFSAATGVEGDVLETVFLDGAVVKEQEWGGIQGRAKVTKPHLEATIDRAVDNLEAKIDFLQKMSAPKAIAVRLAEAACGSKWMAAGPAGGSLADIKKRFPAYAGALDELGITESMDAPAILKTLGGNILDKKAQKSVIALVTEGDMDAAIAKMGDKACISF